MSLITSSCQICALRQILCDLCCYQGKFISLDQGSLKWVQICSSILLGQWGGMRRGTLRQHYRKHWYCWGWWSLEVSFFQDWTVLQLGASVMLHKKNFVLGREKFFGRFLTYISGLSTSEFCSPPFFSMFSRYAASLWKVNNQFACLCL